jgi:two-component sensor histidine kinase
MSETPSGGQGLSSRLIAALVSQLNGKSTLTRDEGVFFEMRLPVGDRQPANAFDARPPRE